MPYLCQSCKRVTYATHCKCFLIHVSLSFVSFSRTSVARKRTDKLYQEQLGIHFTFCISNWYIIVAGIDTCSVLPSYKKDEQKTQVTKKFVIIVVIHASLYTPISNKSRCMRTDLLI